MRHLRLLPIVVLAASALLALKTVGLVSGNGYTLGNLALAQDAGSLSEADQAAADAAAAALFGTGDEDGEGLPSGTQQASPGPSEAVLLQRLAERRAELDAFAAELETRLALVEAAELRIEERLAELGAIETDINSTLDRGQDAEDAQFAALVSMYENMRPADAATIFDDLDAGVLLRVTRDMNPRKLGPVIAKMSPVRAQELTVLLARAEPMLANPSVAQDYSNLPQIMGQ